MDIVDTLSQYSEQSPEWLQLPEPKFDRERFFQSRTVYYPGAWIDAHPLELCNRAHAAHSFIFVDCDYVGNNKEPMEDLRNRLYRVPGKGPGFSGYDVEYDEDVTESVLGWDERRVGIQCREESVSPFIWYVVLKRKECFDDSHGAERFAALFVGGDGFQTFQAVYCERLRSERPLPPWLVMIQDHNGNYGRFGGGGRLERIARRYDVYPKWLLVGSFHDGTPNDPWSGYQDAGATPERGGMHRTLRLLYRRAPTNEPHA